MKETFEPNEMKKLCDRLVELKDQGCEITGLTYVPDRIEVTFEMPTLDGRQG